MCHGWHIERCQPWMAAARPSWSFTLKIPQEPLGSVRFASLTGTLRLVAKDFLLRFWSFKNEGPPQGMSYLRNLLAAR